MLDSIHRILADVAVAATVIGLVWSLAATRTTSFSAGRSFERFQAVVVAILIVTSVVGLGRLISGQQPKEGLHLIYAAVAMALLPLARSFVPSGDRYARIAAVAAFVLLGLVVYRLFTTG